MQYRIRNESPVSLKRYNGSNVERVLPIFGPVRKHRGRVPGVAWTFNHGFYHITNTAGGQSFAALVFSKLVPSGATFMDIYALLQPAITDANAGANAGSTAPEITHI